MILDTSFLIDLMENDVDAKKKLLELIHNGTPQGITTLSIFELWSGISRSNKQEREKKKVGDILLSQTIINLDKASAEQAGIIDGSLINKGEKIDPLDILIAGIAKLRGEKVLTRNVKHFERAGVIVEKY